MMNLPSLVVRFPRAIDGAGLVPRLIKFLRFAALLACLFAVYAEQPGNVMSQQPTPDAKAEEIIKRGIEISGGSSYLNVRSMIARGFYTAYQEGMSQIPARFLDYIVYPDRERTEFTSAGTRVIQANAGETGWVFDGAAKTISEMKPEQIVDFKRSVRTSVENLLRGWWRKDGATLKYVGRREAGLARRNETVRLTYPNGFWVEYEFGAKDGVPAKVIYKRNRKNSDTGDVEEVTEEDRFAKQITIDGVTAPWVIDHFTNKIQTSRINYESIEYNRPVADSLFVKPDNVKSIK
jgi:hypothetical protein